MLPPEGRRQLEVNDWFSRDERTFQEFVWWTGENPLQMILATRHVLDDEPVWCWVYLLQLSRWPETITELRNMISQPGVIRYRVSIDASTWERVLATPEAYLAIEILDA